MKQLIVISGKGGTGKTSVVASFAALAGRVVVADCDVDAADLHLVLGPSVVYREAFWGAKRAVIEAEACMGCGLCAELCRFDAMTMNGCNGSAVVHVDGLLCEGCGVCAWFCPERAIELKPVVTGEWYLSETRHGPLVHARLGAGGENSGKLVSQVREEARKAAQLRDLELVIVDGAPGVGCPVIASISGADLALIVTEPTISGLHDMQRVLDLSAHFKLPVMVLVNRYDINPELAARAEELAAERGAGVAGRIRFDPAVTRAQHEAKAVVELGDQGAAADIESAWSRVRERLSSNRR